jgi:hypothetical protein
MTEQGLKMIDRCPPKLDEQKIRAPKFCEPEILKTDTPEPSHA